MSNSFEESLQCNNIEDFEKIQYGVDFEEIESEIIDQRRWVTVHRSVFKHKESGRFLSACFETASTETSEGSESEEVQIEEVVPEEQVITVFISKG